MLSEFYKDVLPLNVTVSEYRTLSVVDLFFKEIRSVIKHNKAVVNQRSGEEINKALDEMLLSITVINKNELLGQIKVFNKTFLSVNKALHTKYKLFPTSLEVLSSPHSVDVQSISLYKRLGYG